ILGASNSPFFAISVFLPDYLNHLGRPDLIGYALPATFLGQIPASVLLLALAERLARRAWPYVVSGILALVAILGIVITSCPWIVASAALLGFAIAIPFVLVLALPPLVADPHDVHRLSAAMFTISYTCALIVPVICGLAWDLTGIPGLAFAPMALCALGFIALAPTVPVGPKS